MTKTLVVSSICGMLLFSACGNEVTQEQKDNIFRVTRPVVLDTMYHTDYVAEINSLQNVEIRARVKGFIENIHVDEGNYVKQGQILFTISSQEYEEDVLKARANLRSAIAEAKAAEFDVQNTRSLVEKNVISKTELDIAASKLAALQARIEEARSHEASAELKLSFTRVRAPFSGMIDRIPNKRGSLINEGDLLTIISDNNEVFAYFNVSEKEYLDYAEELKTQPARTEVSLILANNELHTEKGVIETTEAQFDKNTGTIAFRAKFPNPEKILKHGSSGKVRLRTKINDALVIPQKSTFEIQDKMYVYVVDENNIARMRSFKPGMRIPHLFIIEDGLTTNDQIIYEGIQDVRDGMKVQTQPVSQTNIIRQLSHISKERKGDL